MPGGRRTDRLARTTAALLLLGAVLIAYAGVYDAPFIFDDPQSVLVAPGTPLGPMLRDRPTRALPTLTFALNRALGGDLAGYHAVNVLIHLLNAFLVLGLLRAMSRLRDPGFPPWVPLLGAMIWALHPLHTGAVTYLSQRLASLGALCYLAAAFCYLRARERRIAGAPLGSRAHLPWYLGALAAALLAATAKENTATLPFAILVLEWLIVGGRATENLPLRFALILPFAITPVLQGAFVLWLKARVGAEQALAVPGTPAPAPFADGGPGGMRFHGYLGVYQGWDFPTSRAYFLTEAGVLLRYLKLWLLPLNQVFDAFVAPVTRISDPRFLAPAAALLALGAAAFTQLRRRPWVFLGVLWFFVTIAVESSVIPLADFSFEHRMLLPSVGLAVSALGLLGPWLSRRPRAGAAILTLIAIVFLAATIHRNRVWESPVALWSDNVAKAPRKLRGWLNLSNAYEMNGQLDLAAEALKRAIAVFDRAPEVHFNLGVVRLRQGLRGAAEQSFRRAIALRPLYAEAFYNLGVIQAETGRTREAERSFRLILQIKSAYVPEARFNMGVLYLRGGRTEEGLRQLEAALPALEDLPQLHEALALGYRRQGRVEAARRHAKAADRLRGEASGRSD